MRTCSPFGCLSLIGMISFAGCSGDDWALLPPSKHPQQNVLVIDDGIDPASQALKRRVAGRYTLTCRQDPPSSAPPPADFQEAKSRALASLQNRDDRCHLMEGIAAKSDPLPSIARYRDHWNDMVRRSDFGMSHFTEAEWQEVTGALDSQLPKAHYHGTATSSVIANDNPNVRLVLIEEPLGDATTAMQNFMCIQQANIDRSVALLSDPDVRQAMINQPPSTIDDEIN